MSENKDPQSVPKTQVETLTQCMKQFSITSPNEEKLLYESIKDASVIVKVRVECKQVAADVYESAVVLHAHADASLGALYDAHLIFSGLFRIQNATSEALEAILNVNCPTLLFPYVRRIIADMTREAGFQPLLLDPYDFAGLLVEKRQRTQPPANTGPNPGNSDQN